MSAEKLKIAISGGGIASMCFAHSLCKNSSQFDVKIFEANDIFREYGAAVGLGENAQATLSLISPALRKALDDADGVRMNPSVRFMMGTGPDSGRLIGDVNRKIPQIIVHRGPFLRKIRELVPDGVVEVGKKLVKVTTRAETNAKVLSTSSLSDSTPAPETVQLHFEDGTSYTADVLIGCDGINSVVRRAVLSEDHPALKSVFTGGYNHRVVVPLSTAIEAFGEEYCKLKTQTAWIGDGGCLITDHVNNGTAMQIIAGWSPRAGGWPYKTAYTEWSKERTREDLAPWGAVGQAMTKIFAAQPVLYAAGGRNHPETPSYCNGHMCIVGDAAQSFPPAQGAGAGQAIEDALILSTVFTTISSIPTHSAAARVLSRALQVYDEIRRLRRADVARTSGEALLFLPGRDPVAGLDIPRMTERVTHWAENVFDYDLEAAVRSAREKILQTVLAAA